MGERGERERALPFPCSVCVNLVRHAHAPEPLHSASASLSRAGSLHFALATSLVDFCSELACLESRVSSSRNDGWRRESVVLTVAAFKASFCGLGLETPRTRIGARPAVGKEECISDYSGIAVRV